MDFAASQWFGALSTLLGWLLLVMAVLAALQIVAMLIACSRYLSRTYSVPRRSERVTLLKPLHGSEPRLAENLASFLEQDHDGPIQLLCGVQNADDPAIETVRALQARFPNARIDLVIDATSHGANGKVSNLINMLKHASHETLILSDSDISVGRDYLAQVLHALDRPGVGAVTCLYRGCGDNGFWSRVGAASISWRFLPGAIFAVTFGVAQPCMGSTIALRRETLEAIGGFQRFTDSLADDYELGAAVQERGLAIAVPAMLVTHGSDEGTFREMWRHELRWARTTRAIVPRLYVGNVMVMPLPLALLGTIFFPLAGAATVAFALLSRLALAVKVDRKTGLKPLDYAYLPLRDLLDFATFITSLFTREVDWRGSHLRLGTGGRITKVTETSE